MSLARSSVRLFIANIAGAGLQFLGITFFAREIGPSQIGVFFLFQALLGMLTIPADLGLRGAVEKRVSEGESPNTYISTAIFLKLIPLSIIILSIVLARPYINRYLGADVALWLAFAIVLQEAAKLTAVALRGELRVGETAELNVAREVTWVGGGAILLGYGLEAKALIYSLLAGFIVMLIIGWYKSSIAYRRPSVSHARSLFNYSRHGVISSIGGYFYSWMDVAIIGLFLTQTHVGAYEVAWRVTAVSILLSRAIAMTIFPQMSEWSSHDSKERIEDLISTVMTPSLFFVIPAFFGTVVFAREILEFVFGGEYLIATVVLIVLMGDKVFQAIQLIVGRALQAIDRPDLAARATIASVISNGVLNVIFVLEFGILGAAFATVTSSLLNDFLHFIYLRKFIQVRFPVRDILECTIASLGMATIMLGLTRIHAVGSLIELAGFIGIGIAIYCCLVFLMPNLRPRALRVVTQFGSVLP